MSIAKSIADEIMKQAYCPSSVLPKVSPSYKPSVDPHQFLAAQHSDPMVHFQLLTQAMMASRIRAQAQNQTTKAISAMADPSKLNWTRLLSADSAAPRKPRIRMWSRVSGRNVLEVLWYPELNEAASARSTFTARIICENSDFKDISSTRVNGEGERNVLLRFREGEYLKDVTSVDERGLIGRRLIRDALTESLTALLTAVSVVCDVSLDTWPVYDENERLVLVSAGDRALTAANHKLNELKSRSVSSKHWLAHTIAQLGLEDVAAFEELVQRAKATSVKMSRLIFEKTGKRCSSPSVDKIASLVDEVTAQDQLIEDVKAQVLDMQYFRYD
jgi:hypothetical protein